MRKIKLITPQYTGDTQTKTEYEAEKINGIKSQTGNDDQPGASFWFPDSFHRQFCLESANELRRMINDAIHSEEIQLDAEAVGLLSRGVHLSDGAIHFIEGDGFLGVVVADYKPEPLRGRTRSLHEHARDELLRHGFIVHKGGGLYQITLRGYAMGDFLAKEPSDGPFHGWIRLPARPVGGEPASPVIYNQNTYNQEKSMNFNQTNNNQGDVNNAISEKGNVVQTTGDANTGEVNSATSEKGNAVQTTGDRNKVQVDHPKESFWSTLWQKVKGCWKWLAG